MTSVRRLSRWCATISSPASFTRSAMRLVTGAFRRLARKCELDLLYRVAKADSLGRNADWVPREKWYDAEAQEWFIVRARELEVESHPPAPILLGRHLWKWDLTPDDASAKSPVPFTRCSWMDGCARWMRPKRPPVKFLALLVLSCRGLASHSLLGSWRKASKVFGDRQTFGSHWLPIRLNNSTVVATSLPNEANKAAWFVLLIDGPYSF